MSYVILFIRHSGASLTGNTNAKSQYGGPMVAAAAICGSCFVCTGWRRRPLSPPGLSVSPAGTKPLAAATGARAKGCVYRQPATPAHSSGPRPLPSAQTTHRPDGCPGVTAMVGRYLCPWLTVTLTNFANVSFNTAWIAVPQPSWPKLTSCWCQSRRTPPNH